jgi:hypothetical protein
MKGTQFEWVQMVVCRRMEWLVSLTLYEKRKDPSGVGL